LPLGHYLNNAENMLHQWSVDRTKHKIFENSVNISIDEWKLTYTWIKDCGRILSVVDQTDSFIVHKSKYDSLVPNYQLLLTNNNNLNFSFDEATNLVSHVFYVVFNRYNWFESSCTCYHYFKSYMCIHIMAVAVSKLMVPVGQKPKRGRITNALKGLQKQ
jgi:hypothetical protein